MTLVLALAGCSTPWVESNDGQWRTLVATLDSNSSGNIRAKVTPRPDETSLLFSLQPEDPELLSHLRFMQVGSDIPYRATDETAEGNPYSRSSAGFVSSATTFNWPIQPSDGRLEAAPHELTVGIVDSSRQYTKGSARVGVVLKSDPDPDAGLLKVNLVFGVAEGGQLSDELYSGVDLAIQSWRDIYENVGVQLDVELYELPYTELMAPGRGDAAAYRDIAESTRFGAVNVVVLEEIADFAGVLGFAGNIPGPLMNTSQSAVVVSSTLAAGPDGRFSTEEINLLGETMAHEVGHFLGLYHPVEASFLSWDNLDDTVECSNEQSCVLELGDNLMFPYPLYCESETGCLPQRRLSVEQAEVANGYVGVL